VEDRNFLVESIDEYEQMYVVDEHGNVLNVTKANMMILINRLKNESGEDNLKNEFRIYMQIKINR
jgi:hypothetical protein